MDHGLLGAKSWVVESDQQVSGSDPKQGLEDIAKRAWRRVAHQLDRGGWEVETRRSWGSPSG